MKIIQVNIGLFGSTGRIMDGIRSIVDQSKGDMVICVYPERTINFRGSTADIKIKNGIDAKLNHFFEKNNRISRVFFLYKYIRFIEENIKNRSGYYPFA